MSEGASARGGRRGRRGTTHSAFYRSTQEQSRALYHCNYCHKDISDNVRIKCADCPDFDLCVECFSIGVEVNGHSNSHSYRVMDNLSFPIFHPNWGSDEELLLLEAVDIYGPGNWAAVAEHVGTKSKQACQAHYFQIYIEPETCPLPTPAPEMAGLDVKHLAAIAKSNCGRKRMRMDETILQHQQQQQQQAAAAAGQSPQQQQQQPLQPKQEPGADADTAGGVDVNNVKQEQQEQQQQEQQRQQQGHVLGKGAKRQRAEDAAAADQEQKPAGHAAAGGLSAQQHPQQASKQLHQEPAGTAAAATAASPAEARGAAAAGGAAGSRPVGLGPVGLGPVAAGGTAAAGGAGAGGAEPPRVRGSGPQVDAMTGWHAKRFEFEPEWDNEAEVSIADIEFKEEEDSPQEVAAKLKVLEIYNKRLDERARRQAFILEHGLLNVRRMQGLERRRMAGERERFAAMRVFARYQPPGSHEGLVEGLLVEGRLRMRIAELQAHRAAGRRTMAEIEEAEMEAAAKKKKEGSKSQGSMAAAADEGGASHSTAGASASAGLGGYRSTASALNVWRQRRGLPLDITGLPGVELLTAREAELCANARLLPVHYLSLKDVMMRDAEVHGHISRMDARSFFRLDPTRSARVWELLCASGWLKGNAPEEAEDKRRGPRGPKKSDAFAVAAAAAAAAAAAGGPSVSAGAAGGAESETAGVSGVEAGEEDGVTVTAGGEGGEDDGEGQEVMQDAMAVGGD